MKQIAIDVREFAVPVPRRGSIEPGSGYKFDGITALGQDIHKVIQNQRKGVHDYYRSEVKISHKFYVGEYCITVSGRIDGLFEPIDQNAKRVDQSEKSNEPAESGRNSACDLSAGTGAIDACDASQAGDANAHDANDTNIQNGQTRRLTLAHETITPDSSFPSALTQAQNALALVASTQPHTTHLIGEPACNSSASASDLGKTLPDRFAHLSTGQRKEQTRAPVQLSLLSGGNSIGADNGPHNGVGRYERSDDKPHVEEIKTAFDADKLARRLRINPEHPYCLQAKIYAYLYWKQYGIAPSASLYIVSLLSGATADVDVHFDAVVFEKWVNERLQNLIDETVRQEGEFKRRQAVAANLVLPFERARPGQEELIAQIEDGMSRGKPILVQAPTGLGKTIATLLPSLRDALSRGQRLIYTTPKNSIHLVAEEAVSKLRERSAKIKSLTLTAKSKLCMLEEQICDPHVCEYAKDYYTKIADNDLINKASQNDEMNGKLFSELGAQYKVCPFELSIDCIDRADVVICDYNHVFAPISLSGRLTAPTHKKNAKANLIIDEAHNLHARATGYFSGSLSTVDLRAMHTQLQGNFAKLAELCQEGERLVRRMVIGRFEREGRVTLIENEFVEIGDKITAAVFAVLEHYPDPKSMPPVMGFWRLWSDFCSGLQQEDLEQFQTYTRENKDVVLKVTCCDASAELRKQYTQFENVLAFSATLKPFEYYSKLSGFDNESTHVLEASCPFPRENRKVVVIPQVSTKYKDRAANAGKICEAITRIVGLKKANYILFFPSFEYLEQIHERLSVPSEFKVIVQRRSMTRSQVTDVLDQLKLEQGCLLFAVQGGVFAEGVDFAGDMASGAIIVGPGLPAYHLERELLREYYERTYGSGFEYAYTYPAMTKVVQSAGRVVRSETDRGLIVLLDRRFIDDTYAQAMPKHWFSQSVNELVSTSILHDIATFWQESAIATS